MMEVKEAMGLYREVLRKFTEGFFPGDALESVASYLGAGKAVLFLSKRGSSFMEPKIVHGLDREEMGGVLIPLKPQGLGPHRKYVVLSREFLLQYGMEELAPAGETAVLLPFPSITSPVGAAIFSFPAGARIPEQSSPQWAAAMAVLEKLADFLETGEGGKTGEGTVAALEVGLLSQYIMEKNDLARASSLCLDLLVKLLNMDGGSVYRITWKGEEPVPVPVSARGWMGTGEIISKLLDMGLVDTLRALGEAGEREICLDTGRVASYFPEIRPYFHTFQIRSFLLSPLFDGERLTGFLALFGKSYASIEGVDTELFMELTRKLGRYFGKVVGEKAEPSGTSAGAGLDLEGLCEELTGLSEMAVSPGEFLSGALKAMAIGVGSPMAFSVFRVLSAGEECFQWYSEEVYGGETVFRPGPELSRVVLDLERMSVIRPDSQLMGEMPGGEQAREEGMVLLLVPSRSKEGSLLHGFYFPRERKLSRKQLYHLGTAGTLAVGLAMGVRERRRADGFRRSLEILTDLEGEMASHPDIRRVLKRLAKGGKELLACEKVTILAFDGEGIFHGAVDVEGKASPGGGFPFPRVEGPYTGDFLGLLQSAIEGRTEPGQEGQGDESTLAVPLVGRRGALGHMAFQRGKERPFDEFEGRLAHFLAGQAAAIIESGLEERELKQLVEEYRGLSRFLEQAGSSELRELLESFYRQLGKSEGIDFFLFSLSGETGRKTFIYHRDRELPEESLEELLDARGPFAVELRRSGRLVRNNLNTLSRVAGEDDLVFLGVRSYLALRRRLEGREAWAVFGSPEGGAFDDRRVGLLEKAFGWACALLPPILRLEELQGRVRVLEEVRRSQEEKLKAKTDLINMASHEVRHPLTLIMGFTEILRDYSDLLDGKERKEVLEKLYKASDKLRRSVINMMEVSRLESGRLALNLEEVDLPAILDSLREELLEKYPGSRIKVAVKPGAERIRADRDKLEIILFNLLDNAVKYSPEGSPVEVGAQRSGREVLMEVKDRGRGLTEEEIGYIFQPFRRGEEGTASRVGMGLGLYIVSRLVEAHGGRIEVKSDLGKGSTFVVHLPQPEAMEGYLDTSALTY
jgi:signal transduction histidine kinase